MGYEVLRLRPAKRYPRKGALKFLVGGKSACLAETPKLRPYEFNADDYARIIFGFPVWAGNVTPPIRTFIEENLELLLHGIEVKGIGNVSVVLRRELHVDLPEAAA